MGRIFNYSRNSIFCKVIVERTLRKAGAEKSVWRRMYITNVRIPGSLGFWIFPESETAWPSNP